MSLLVFVVLLVTLTNDVTALQSASLRSDDASFQSLMTLVQNQAATIQRQEASLQAMQSRMDVLEHSQSSDISRLEHSHSSDISRLEQSISNNLASINSVNTRLNTQVFFTAHMTTSPVIIGQGSPIKFDAVVNNVGGAYNPATGVFIAPVTGVYVLYAQLMKHLNTGYFHWAIDKSGTLLCRNSVDSANDYDKSSCLATVRLQKGDQVTVRQTDGSNHLEGYWWCSFSGYLTSMDP